MEEVNEQVCALRQMSCELGQLSRPDGDVTVTQGDTCAVVAVYGPCEVRMNKELLDRTTIDVTYKPKSGLPKCADKMFERVIRNTCETIILTTLHPRSSINIIIQEMQDSGSFLSCCMNAACLALLDASVSLKYLIASVTCAIDSDGGIILDPTSKQEKLATSTLTFVFDKKNYDVVSVTTKGSYTQEQFNKCLILCRQASKNVFQFYRDSMEKKLSKSLKLN